MSDWISAILLLFGAAFILLAAVGVIRMPDLFTRMQAASKSSTLGIVGMVLAVAVAFEDLAVTAQAFLVISFVFLTTPIAAHMIARAAYLVGVPLWEGTIVDELRGRHPRDNHPADGEGAPLGGGEGDRKKNKSVKKSP